MRRRRNRALAELGLRPSRLSAADLVREAALSVLRHPGRSIVTVIGTILGVAAFVASSGLTATLGQQVSTSFDVRRATEVLVQPQDSGLPSTEWLAASRTRRLQRLNGVVNAGRRVLVGEQPFNRLLDNAGPPVMGEVIGADPGALRAMGPTLVLGRTFDEYHQDQQSPVVLLSTSLARKLSIARVGVAVFIRGRAYVVMGIYSDVARRSEAVGAAIVPYSVGGQADFRLDNAGTKNDVLIETSPGAAQLIARQAVLVLSPDSPARLRSIAPPDPRTLRQEVESNLTRSTLLLSVVSLLVGTISIGNAASAGIAARAGEIGLRRAIGGRGKHIFAQLVTESAVLGGVGGAIGAGLGIVGVSIAAVANGWAPVVDVRVSLLACAASACSGMLAGSLPAVRAARIPPVQALQR
jgi:putative ABC transport system permease protein